MNMLGSTPLPSRCSAASVSGSPTLTTYANGVTFSARRKANPSDSKHSLNFPCWFKTMDCEYSSRATSSSIRASRPTSSQGLAKACATSLIEMVSRLNDAVVEMENIGRDPKVFKCYSCFIEFVEKKLYS